MRIENLRTDRTDDKARVTADIVWEDCDQEPQALFYETTMEFSDDIFYDPHAFLIGALLPALQHGEQRISIDASICPELRNGVMIAMSWLRKWGLIERSLCIEARSAVAYPPVLLPRAASFFSGGVDSSAVLRANRLDFPDDHPSALRNCLFVHGFDIGGMAELGPELASYEMALQAASAIAQDAGVTLIPIFTNVRHLYDDVYFWIQQFHGAALASAAHVFSRRLTSVAIALDFDIANLLQAANNPLLESNFSSAGLRIRHEGLLYSRLDKVRLLSGWQAALDHMRVCTMNPPGKLNCGECEKCLRTMLQLLACDSLDKAAAFPYADISPEMLVNIRLTEPYQDVWYRELITPLTERGRFDLVEVIQKKRREFEKLLAWKEERDWKGAVKRFDRKWLGQSMYKTYAKILSVRSFMGENLKM